MRAYVHAAPRITAGTGTVVTQTADNQLKVNVPSDFSFDVGRADIRPQMRPVLDEMAKPWRLSGGVRPYKAVGCLECRHTGYRGRAGLYELLVVSDTFKEKVSTGGSIDQLRRQAITDGMRPLR